MSPAAFPLRRASVWPSLFRRNAEGAAAVEFALVSMPFLALVFCIIQVSLDFLVFSQIDYAAFKASQSIRSGEVQRKGMTAEQFKTNLMCPQLRMVDCASVQVNVRRITTNSQWWQLDAPPTGPFYWCPGGSGDQVLVQIFAPVPFLSAMWSGDPNATGTRTYKSAVALRNDPFGLPSPGGAGC